ncbi:unnamed protein product [Caenorhabditis auriculariae]|uniref:Uncharacterized protein n=1 Tax=Caenorhabditis auriculariae TaxID=2777116 RepID=A0A8S1H4E7_9PELO|nr:unnamed protein product [Caenorhabditis auriculariae]
MEQELIMMQAGSHPALLERLKQLDDQTKKSLQHNEIEYERKLREIEDEYRYRNNIIFESTKKKIDDLKETMMKELLMLERKMEIEFASSDISKPAAASLIEANKKTLRGRGGVLVEPPTYFNSTPKAPQHTQQAPFVCLLKDSEVNADLKVCQILPSPVKGRRNYDVAFLKQKLSYEGKGYKQGEEIFLESSEYGKFTAKIENINERIVTFKASQPWDMRLLHMCTSDFVEGRVKVSKKKN